MPLKSETTNVLPEEVRAKLIGLGYDLPHSGDWNNVWAPLGARDSPARWGIASFSPTTGFGLDYQMDPTMPGQAEAVLDLRDVCDEHKVPYVEKPNRMEAANFYRGWSTSKKFSPAEAERLGSLAARIQGKK